MSLVETEEAVVECLDRYLVQQYYYTAQELQIVDLPAEITERIGRVQVRIDLAAYSRIDQSLIFIEAERHVYPQHPAIYEPFADYVFLAIPRTALTGPEMGSQQLDQHLSFLKRRKLGLIVVDSLLPDETTDHPFAFEIVLHAERTPVDAELRRKVLRAFDGRVSTVELGGYPSWA